MVFLMSDHNFLRSTPDNTNVRKEQVSCTTMDGPCHLLVHTGKLAKRVSHNTSHAESLSQYGVVTHAEMVALRLTELRYPSPKSVPLSTMIHVEERGIFDVPTDIVTDCRDLWELETGQKGVPQDRTQRLIIMSLRERRSQGRIRNTIWTDTRDMIANSLTKHVSFDAQLNTLLTLGCLKHGFASLRRKSVVLTEITEGDLLRLQD